MVGRKRAKRQETELPT